MKGDIFLMAAMEIEIKPLLSRFRKVSHKDPLLYLLKTADRNVWLLISGVGNRQAREAASWVSARAPKLVLSLGYAGGLSSSLVKGEIFLPSQVRNQEGKSFFCHVPSACFPKQPKGTLLTVDRVIQSREDKERLHPLADAVDMESFPIAEVMSRSGTPFASIRIISDTAKETLPLDFTGLLQGRRALFWGAVNLLLQNPLKIPSIIKLGFQSKMISDRLSRFSLSALSALNGQ